MYKLSAWPPPLIFFHIEDLISAIDASASSSFDGWYNGWCPERCFGTAWDLLPLLPGLIVDREDADLDGRNLGSWSPNEKEGAVEMCPLLSNLGK